VAINVPENRYAEVRMTPDIAISLWAKPERGYQEGA
jgi:hypothetical protein